MRNTTIETPTPAMEEVIEPEIVEESNSMVVATAPKKSTKKAGIVASVGTALGSLLSSI